MCMNYMIWQFIKYLPIYLNGKQGLFSFVSRKKKGINKSYSYLQQFWVCVSAGIVLHSELFSFQVCMYVYFYCLNY